MTFIKTQLLNKGFFENSNGEFVFRARKGSDAFNNLRERLCIFDAQRCICLSCNAECSEFELLVDDDTTPLSCDEFEDVVNSIPNVYFQHYRETNIDFLCTSPHDRDRCRIYPNQEIYLSSAVDNLII